MTEPTLGFVACADPDGGHRMAYWQWGKANASHVVLCVHGLARQGRDFDELARALVERANGNIRVVCPDVVGRGRSDWLRNPDGYQLPTYAADMLALLANLHAGSAITELDYVGTSMGGLVGIALAGSPKLPIPSPVRRLVLNDVGPEITQASVERIGAYIGKGGKFASLEAAADALLLISAGFGVHTREQWLELSRHMVVPAASRSEDGSTKVVSAEAEGPVVLHYDPAIGVPIRAVTSEARAQGEAIMWHLYDAVTARTLLLRGAQSDLLTPETAHAMTQRGARARLIEFEGVGHAPTLVSPAQHTRVVDFLIA
ncbi:alpha/beta fold hydrolase [Variovorax sp. YR216]|uniref:alpha/beta fold hydrolase n=1 Tax=Variovorax sp. YR216 TaxID=1882828 RepID=UPI0008982144|nr:alpha/beta hydrolase [Variovorax sp. YR216]SEB24355.1 Pimeloyl-ACP methyl ester carboxylesterase [Variovorax sp. YR216]